MFDKFKLGLLGRETFASCKSRVAFLLCHNRFRKGEGTMLKLNDAILKNCSIEIHGKNCLIEIGRGSRLAGCRIEVFGDDCKIRIGDGNKLNSAWLWAEDMGSSIIIGDGNDFTGRIQLAAIEGTTITIGDDCLFSRDIQISTGDSHSIVDKTTGKRINPSQDINIGNHVWVGMNVTVTKGVCIPDNVIVGRGSIVTRTVDESNVAVAGIPARIVRENVDWDASKLPVSC